MVILMVMVMGAGVVYIDDAGERRVLLKSDITGSASVKLNQCGIAAEFRFSFYDQNHTTGMDIPQSAAARAALTISKDMTFR